MRPAERTLQWVRKHGALAAIVEKWNPHVGGHGIRQDLFGLVDVLSLWQARSDYIQCCGVDVASHITKIKSSVDLQARLQTILCDPTRNFFIIGWRKRQLKTQKRPEWVVRILQIDRGFNYVEWDTSAYLPINHGELNVNAKAS